MSKQTEIGKTVRDTHGLDEGYATVIAIEIANEILNVDKEKWGSRDALRTMLLNKYGTYVADTIKQMISE